MMVDKGAAITLSDEELGDQSAHSLAVNGKSSQVYLRCQWHFGQDSGHD